MKTERICPDCDGTGLMWCENIQDEDTCKTCDGEGVIVRVVGAEKLTRKELNDDNTNNA